MKYKINDVVVFTIFCLFIFKNKCTAQAQDTLRKPFELGIEGHYGSVLKHTHKLDPIKTGNPYGIQLYFARNTNGTRSWHQLFNYPTYGASLTYMSLGNKKILGEAVIGLAYIQIAILRFHKSSIHWHFGTGLAYCNTVYNMETNPLNKAISAHVNYSLQSQFNFSQQVSEQFKIKIGAGMTHISNGSIKKPNLGINIPSVNFGIFYNPVGGRVTYNKRLLEPYKKDWRLNMAYYVSFSRLDTMHQTLYPAHVISLYASKRISRIHSLLFGVDGIYDNSVKAEIERQKSWGLHPKETVERVLVTFGHELTITRLAFTSQIGFYVYKPFKSKSWSYQRFNLKYYLSNKFFIGSALRTHFGTADGVEIGLGAKI